MPFDTVPEGALFEWGKKSYVLIILPPEDDMDAFRIGYVADASHPQGYSRNEGVAPQHRQVVSVII